MPALALRADAEDQTLPASDADANRQNGNLRRIKLRDGRAAKTNAGLFFLRTNIARAWHDNPVA
jgi:hypothetical protein